MRFHPLPTAPRYDAGMSLHPWINTDDGDDINTGIIDLDDDNGTEVFVPGDPNDPVDRQLFEYAIKTHDEGCVDDCPGLT